MDPSTIRQVLEEEAEVLVPFPADLRPRVLLALSAERAAAQRRRFGVVGAILVAVVALAVTLGPAYAGAIGQDVVARLQVALGGRTEVQMQRDVQAPVAVAPSPPFSVFQPTALPVDLPRRGVTYDPGAIDPATGLRLPSVEGTGDVDYVRLGLRIERRDAFLLVRYVGSADRGTGGRELILLERQATHAEQLPAGSRMQVLGQPASLGRTANGLLLSTIMSGTWLQVWTNVSQMELDQVVRSLQMTSPGNGAPAPPTYPTATPAPSPVPGSYPPLVHPTYLPAGFDNASIGYFTIPPEGQNLRLPPLNSGVSGPVRRSDLKPILERLDWPQIEKAWNAVGGGVFGGFFTGDTKLDFLEIGPVRLDGSPDGTAMTTDGGRTVWMVGSEAGAGFKARWRDGSPLDLTESYLAQNPNPRAREVVIWVDGDRVVWLRSDLPQTEMLRFIDGLTTNR